MPDELSPRHIRRRLLQLAAVVTVVVAVLIAGPGLGSLRREFSHASAGWLLVGVGCEILSALSYVVIFRAVFCRRMSWRLSYQIGMAEQGANSVLSVSGAGGLALGVWALRRGGMSVEHIGRRTVAFFFLTSLPNVSAVMVIAVLSALGLLGVDRSPAFTYAAGAAAAIATAAVLSLPLLLRDRRPARPRASVPSGRVASALGFARRSLAQGVLDGVSLLRHRPLPVLAGGFGTMAFDLAVLGSTFKATGHWPGVGVLALGYLIGLLGGNLPIPGGIGGVDAGLVGVFALYHQPLAATTAAVLLYHAISLWVPAVLGSVAFVKLRATLHRSPQPASICLPLADPLPRARPAALAQ